MILKSQIILDIYYSLINYGQIKLDDILIKYKISVRTFRRYISEINAFLYNNYIYEEVVYDHYNKVYFLKKNKGAN